VKGQSGLNGIEFLEVRDDPGQPDEDRQRFLEIHFINPLTITLSKEEIRIEGGHRIRNITVKSVGKLGKNTVVVELDRSGDFSFYTLRLIGDEVNGKPPEGIDPLFSAVDFSFKVNCPSDFDCKVKRHCPERPAAPPNIDYLAKDYASFRRLILDRLSVLVPDWKERNPADTGVALAELLAYAGDYLSYRQDAVATEAYLDTARRRVSVRRHARLIDYRLQEGCNARVWVQIEVDNNGLELDEKTRLLTCIDGMETHIEKALSLGEVRSMKAEVFETMHSIKLFEDHNKMKFYTWGERECCLPKGATRATLEGYKPNLKAGDVLVFVENFGPHTHEKGDADPAHRHAVRLTRVEKGADPIGKLFLEESGSGGDTSVDVTEIEWSSSDALPFPLCISSRIEKDDETVYLDEVSVAHGNIVLADHGMTISNEMLGPVPEARPELYRVEPLGAGRCDGYQLEAPPLRFRPTLEHRPLTHRVRFNPEKPPSSASESITQDPRKATPAIHLQESSESNFTLDMKLAGRIKATGDETAGFDTALNESGKQWEPRVDLLDSGRTSRDFVVEVESDGTAGIRFGDDRFGRRPAAGTTFSAEYRVGNGACGNIGAETLRHVESADSHIVSVCNWLPGAGGVEPESMEEVRRLAPYIFRKQMRAVTAEDYAAVAERHGSVQSAAATLRWTGSWHTVYVTIDRYGGLDIDDGFEKSMKAFMNRFRMAGHDIVIEEPRYVPLEIEMKVCVDSGYFRSNVEAAMMRLFSNAALPDGRLAVFHPDNFVFGQPVYLSRLYEAAESIDGVLYAEVTKFQRLGVQEEAAEIESKLAMGRLEIARLDNDPNFPDHGVFRLRMEGGK
jgi:hypothetical protein